jgi:uncharacterized protein
MPFALVFPTLVTVVYFVLLADHPAAWQQGAYAIGKLLQFGFPLLWIGLVERRPWKLRRPKPRELIEGFLLGGIILAGMLILYLGWLKRGGIPPEAVAAIRAKVAGVGVASLPRFAALGIFYALGHSLMEEYYWRWFVYGQLRGLTRPSLAVVISSLGFMAHHVCVLGLYFGWTSGLTMFFSVSVAVGGMLWAWLYRRHGSLYGVWLSHLLVDAGIFAVGYDLVLR